MYRWQLGPTGGGGPQVACMLRVCACTQTFPIFIS